MRTSVRLAASAAVLALVPVCSTARGGSAAPTTTVRVTGHQVVLTAADRSGSGVAGVRYRLDGGPWRDYGAAPRAILDRSAASFARWVHDGLGSFTRNADGSVQTDGGLGMLWYPKESFGDVAIRLQWRDVGGGSNGGVLIRFPQPREATALGATKRPCQQGVGTPLIAAVRPEWVAVTCGHEVQINDGDTDAQKTGSVYNFRPLATSTPGPRPWNDYEVRITGGPSYRVVVLRNGRVLNNWVNKPGQQASRPGDPPTDDRQLASGYVGLQNHGTGDVIAYRDVTVTDLRPSAGALVVGVGRHVIEVSARDWAGHTEPVRRVVFTVS
jgi:hypothetical protein